MFFSYKKCLWDGGGILATNSFKIYQNALEKMHEFAEPPARLTIYRILRNIIDTKRNTLLGKILYKILIVLKGEMHSYSYTKNQLFRISTIEKKISAHQISRFSELHLKRKEIGKLYFGFFNEKNLIHNNDIRLDESSFTRFYIYNPLIRSKELIKDCNDAGIEIMHIEQKGGSLCQELFVLYDQQIMKKLPNYLKVHDSLISLPIAEDYSITDIRKISEFIAKRIKSN